MPGSKNRRKTMKSGTYNHRWAGMPALENEEKYVFAQERYRDLLREAEEYRQAIRSQPYARPASSRLTLQMVRQFFARLLPGRFVYAHAPLRHVKKSL
jgi:hypothetical protein